MLRIDPQDFLFPLLDSWPTPSESAETLLVRRQGESVLYLNYGRRRREDSVLWQPAPSSAGDLIAPDALRGEGSERSGRDRRGVESLAAVRPVDNSDWYLLAKIDRQEVDAPAVASALKTLFITALLMLITGLVGWFSWRGQDKRLLRQQNQVLEQRVQQRPAAARAASFVALGAGSRCQQARGGGG